MNSKTQKALPIVLSVFASLGVVGTSILSAIETVKAKPKLDKAKETGNKKVLVKEFIKDYKWTLLAGSATVASIVSGTIISKRIEASLSATVIMLDTALRKYKNKAEQVLGDKAKEITKQIAEDDYNALKNKNKDVSPRKRSKVLYHEEHIGFFYAFPESLDKAEAITNEKIITSYCGKEKTPTDHWASLRTFLDDCNAELVDDPENPIDSISFDYGWSIEYVKTCWGEDDIFIHLKRNVVTDENGNVKYIEVSFDKEPVADLLNYETWRPMLTSADDELAAGQDEESDYSTRSLGIAEELCNHLLEKKK